MSAVEFEGFRKIPRLRRDVIITEKIDGTNAQVVVTKDGQVYAGSRKRYITPEDDNYGFASWVKENEEHLRNLGPGRHFGEWWGKGIQKRYDDVVEDRYFSLFNVDRWREWRPMYCDLVPVLYEGVFSERAIEDVIDDLRMFGSKAAPGCLSPEGVIVYHTASNSLFKVTLEDDELPKALAV